MSQVKSRAEAYEGLNQERLVRAQWPDPVNPHLQTVGLRRFDPVAAMNGIDARKLNAVERMRVDWEIQSGAFGVGEGGGSGDGDPHAGRIASVGRIRDLLAHIGPTNWMEVVQPVILDQRAVKDVAGQDRNRQGVLAGAVRAVVNIVADFYDPPSVGRARRMMAIGPGRETYAVAVVSESA